MFRPGASVDVPRGQPGQQAPAPGQKDENTALDTSTSVRSKFPETWIWTEARTGYVILVMIVIFAVMKLFIPIIHLVYFVYY